MNVNTEAARIAAIKDMAEARAELNRVLSYAVGESRSQVDAEALDFNARLVTALRARGVKIWD